MPPAMTSLRVLLLVTLGVGVLPIQPAGAQGTQPLRKAELVRMLARRALSKPQIATLVRRNCVTFPQELVLEVRDTTGAPFVGQPVTITTSSGGGTVTPSAAESDTSGVVRVRVTLGERAGATTITARVETLTRTVLVRVDPGPPEALVVERGDTAVVGALTLRAGDTA